MTTPAAGWYHDPSDSGAWRWWDGATWTAHVRPKEQTAPVSVIAAVPQQPVTAPVAQAVSEPPTISAPQPTYTAPVPQQTYTAPIPQQPYTAPIPQPGQIAQTGPVAQSAAPAPPAPPVRPATLTPETPASEQIYWHSAEAEVIKIPGRSQTSADAVFRKGGEGHVSGHYARFWGEVGSPQTVGIWLLAFLPIIASLLSSVAGLIFQAIIGPNGAIIDPAGATQKAFAVLIGYVAVVVISAWIFAGRDIKMLRVRGYDPPKIWWMLVPLSPLAYFIARGKVVRAEGKRAWPPELLFFLSIIIPIVLFVAAMIFAMSVLASLAGSAGIPI